MKVFFFIILFSFGQAQAQTSEPTPTPNGADKTNMSAKGAYELKEALFKKSEAAKKIAINRRREISDKQALFRQRIKTLTDTFQTDLKKIEKEQNQSISEINKRYDEQAKENAAVKIEPTK